MRALILSAAVFLFTTRALALPPGVHSLIDRSLIADLKSAEHRLHPPERCDVVLTLDRRWEGPMSGYGTALRDPDGRIRLYYRGGGDIDPPEVTCLAVSDDGTHFTRPDIGAFTVRGTKQNNVVFTADRPSYGESHNFAPFLDANPAALPDAKWKAVALRTDTDDKGERHRMLTVLASADGRAWRHLAERPVIRSGGFDSLNVAFFDIARGEYACYFRVGRDGRRSFARAHSPDFLHWELDAPLVFRPEQDEQWYTNGVTPYPGTPSLYLALPMRFIPERKQIGDPPRKTDGLSDAVLMSSRDGLAWDRTFREALIRPGPKPDNWGNAHGNNTPLTGIIETAPGEWSIYWFENYGQKAPRIRRGTVRAHGLASVHAGADGGEFITPPLRFDPGHDQLRLNAATSAAGSVRVEVLDSDARPLEGFTAPDAVEFYGDEPAALVRWKGTDRLPSNRDLRLRFILRDADIYALLIR